MRTAALELELRPPSPYAPFRGPAAAWTNIS